MFLKYKQFIKINNFNIYLFVIYSYILILK